MMCLEEALRSGTPEVWAVSLKPEADLQMSTATALSSDLHTVPISLAPRSACCTSCSSPRAGSHSESKLFLPSEAVKMQPSCLSTLPTVQARASAMLLHKSPLYASGRRPALLSEGTTLLLLHLYGDRALLPLKLGALQAGASALPLHLLAVHAAGLAPAPGP